MLFNYLFFLHIAKWTTKKAYVDSRSRTRDSNSDRGFKFKKPLDLPGNTVCYVDDISIPHTWRTIEPNSNKFYIIVKVEYLSGYEMAYSYDAFVLTLTVPEGNYTGANLSSGIQDLLSGFAVTFGFEVLYHPARGTITIEATYEGVGSHNKFSIPSDFGIMTWMSSADSGYPWKDRKYSINRD